MPRKRYKPEEIVAKLRQVEMFSSRRARAFGLHPVRLTPA